jgi:SAM-dependent methyltransferase
MSRGVDTEEFWRRRIRLAEDAGEDYRQALYPCNPNKWKEIEAYEKGVLEDFLVNLSYRTYPHTSILDVGCGYGRLLSLLPREYVGYYHGIDISSDMIAIAKYQNITRDFAVHDIQKPYLIDRVFDVACVFSVRGMIINDLGTKQWERMQENILKIAKTILFTEYTDV